MAQRRFSIGTTPEIISNVNPFRASISVIMLPTSVEAGNTGRIHIGKGFAPSNVVGATNQGDILEQAGQINEIQQFEGDPSMFHGQWWAIASAAGQIITVDEMTNVPREEK